VNIPQGQNTIGTLPTPAPTRTGYVFMGWFTAETGGAAVTAATNVPAGTGNVATYHAQWERDVNITGDIRISTRSYFFLAGASPIRQTTTGVYTGELYGFQIQVRAYPGVGETAYDVELYVQWPVFMDQPMLFSGATLRRTGVDYIVLALGDLDHNVIHGISMGSTALANNNQANLIARLSPIAQGGTTSLPIPSQRISTISYVFYAGMSLETSVIVNIGDFYAFNIMVRAYPGVGETLQNVRLFKEWPAFMGTPDDFGTGMLISFENGYAIFDLGDLPHNVEVNLMFGATAIDTTNVSSLTPRLSVIALD